jgi:hypothetical protein
MLERIDRESSVVEDKLTLNCCFKKQSPDFEIPKRSLLFAGFGFGREREKWVLKQTAATGLADRQWWVWRCSTLWSSSNWGRPLSIWIAREGGSVGEKSAKNGYELGPWMNEVNEKRGSNRNEIEFCFRFQFDRVTHFRSALICFWFDRIESDPSRICF